MNDAVSPALRALAALFSEALADVKFPDIDAPALTAAVARVDALAAEVARLEQELAQARTALDAGRDELARQGARAHAYARVFAEDDEALRARVDAISLPRAPRRAALPAAVSSLPPTGDAAPRRKRKKADGDAELFADDAAHAAE